VVTPLERTVVKWLGKETQLDMVLKAFAGTGEVEMFMDTSWWGKKGSGGVWQM